MALESFRRDVESGIAWRRSERLAAIGEAIDHLRADDASIRARGLERFAGIIAEETRALREREMRNDLIELDERQRHVWIARLGLLTEIFVSEDGEVCGQGGRGGASAVIATGDAAEEVRRAMEILDRRLEPRLVHLPIVRARVEEPERTRP